MLSSPRLSFDVHCRPGSRRGLRPAARAALLALGFATLGFGGCAQSPQQLAAASHGKEYFPSSVYGAASRRVVADGQPIPRGGGQYLVGKPYTVAGQTYYPSERRIVQVGNASWYGDAFHGRLTANGEIYDRDGFTAAHPTMPLPSYARVTNLRNNYSMIVRVNDRGPYASNRIMDVSRRVAETLDFKRYGTAKIKVEYVGRASLAGSDDAKLYATLRTNGPAPWQGEPTMVAESQQPRPQVASLAPYVPSQRVVPVARPVPAYRQDDTRSARMRRDDMVAPERLWPRERDLPRRELAREEDRPRPAYGRYATSRDMRPMPVYAPFARRDDSMRPLRVASREPMPHLPIRDLLPPPRNTSRADVVRSSRRVFLPPSRPIDLGTIPGAASPIAARRRTADLRMTRYRDD